MGQTLLGVLVVALVASRVVATGRRLLALRGGRRWDDPLAQNPLYRESGFQERSNAVWRRVLWDIVMIAALTLGSLIL